MAPTPALDPAILEGFRGVLAEQKSALTKGLVTQDEAAAAVKAADDKIAALLKTVAENNQKTLDDRIKDVKAENERLIKERTARSPFQIGSGTDDAYRSLGQKFAEDGTYKSWAANTPQRGRLNVTIEGRMQRKAMITEGALPAGTILPIRQGVFAPVNPPLVMRDLVSTVPISVGNAIDYVSTTYVAAADYQVAEGDKKAEVTATYLPKTALVRTIAAFMKASRQIVSDIPGLISTLDDQLLYQVAAKEDREILFGDNGAGHIWGLMPQASSYTPGVVPGVVNGADEIGAAIAFLGAIGFAATAIVLNPMDWAALQIAKTTQGIYILGGPPAGLAARTLWSLPIATSAQMTPGQYLVGAFPGNAVLFDRETASIDISYENEDDFVRNMVTIRCEERIAFAVYRPQAFMKGNLAGPYFASEQAPPPPPARESRSK